jgi:hypothetical protein
MADRKSGEGGRKGTQRKAIAKKAAAKIQKGRASGRAATKKAALSKAAQTKKTAKKTAKKVVKKAAVSAKTASKPKVPQAKVVSGAGKAASRPVRVVAMRAETSPLPPLPPPFTAPPKKVSRSLVRRAVCASTAAQRGPSLALASPEPLSESELREKMRIASLYIDTWLNRRMAPEADASGPEEAWMQVWLWLKRVAPLDDGRLLTQDLFEALYSDEIEQN